MTQPEFVAGVMKNATRAYTNLKALKNFDAISDAICPPPTDAEMKAELMRINARLVELGQPDAANVVMAQAEKMS